MEKIKQNPLKSKQDITRALEGMIEPLRPYYSKSYSRINLGNTGAGHPKETAGIEAFLRVLWGLTPLLAGGGKSPLYNKELQGIINGTDPSHPDYWGDIHDYDQRMVEMAAIGFSLALAPTSWWEVLNDKEKANLANWLRQINLYEAHDCNWLFFAVMVNIGLKKVSERYDQNRIEANLDRIDTFYLGDGWYKDGVNGHSDYYTPFAIHFYGMFYAKLMDDEDPDRAAVYRERAHLFAKDYINWFGEDGSAVPYGRSMTYRFAQGAFWSAYVFADVQGFSLSVTKGLILRHLRYWLNKPIFQGDDTLSIGYVYPNLLMAEDYNAPGSPYWSLKTFLILALPDQHPFWQAEEGSLPDLPASIRHEKAGFILSRDKEIDHVVAFPSGNYYSDAHTHSAAKYEKFAYSNIFGFSVARAEVGLDQGAFDSILALSEGDDLYRVKRKVIEKESTATYHHIKWKPWNDVTVDTWIIPGLPWHVRLHRIETGRDVTVADGGFALSIDQVQAGLTKQDADQAFAHFQAGTVGVKSLYGGSQLKNIYPNSNTNLIAARTVIPTATANLNKGVHWYCHAFYGQPTNKAYQATWNAAPIVKQEATSLAVYLNQTGEEIFKQELY